MNNSIRLSALMVARRAEILDRWMKRIAREHTDKELTRGELWDHLPHFFDAMLMALSADEEPSTAMPASAASSAHGSQRLRVGFDLSEVIREYEILTECILDEVEAIGGSISTRHFRRVLRLLNAGRLEAVSAYVDRRDAEIARAHSQHVGFVAHELRNPLMNAFIAATVLRKTARSEDEWTLSLLTRNLVALRELTDQVLTADRLAGRLQLTREPLELRTVLEQALTETRLAAEQRQIEFVVNLPDALPFSGDRRLLCSAIGNVLGNAVKFTPEGGKITVQAKQHNGRIGIEIEDSCGGLPEGNAKELFEPFVQRSDNRTGFGLGLAIVKQAIEAHGGVVSVRDLPGKGCVFSLELPLSKDD